MRLGVSCAVYGCLRCRTQGFSIHFLLGAGSVVLEFLRFWVPKDESGPCGSILAPARVTAAEANRRSWSSSRHMVSNSSGEVQNFRLFFGWVF